MNDMTTALKAAGVKLPSLKRRIWNYLKEHPTVPASRVAEEMLQPLPNIQKTLSIMKKHGCITGEAYRMGRKTYLCYSVVGDTYACERPVVIKAIDIKPDEKAAAASVTIGGWNAAQFCTNLTLGELLALRTYLAQVLR